MKHIIVEGGDGLGKNTLIKNLCNYFDYNNVTIRHFDKPPKGMDAKETLAFQFEVFYKEILFVDHIRQSLDSDDLGYHENIVIWNRSHLGEYVYSQMFRGINRKEVSEKLRLFEERNLYTDMFLITLTAEPRFFHAQEDGDSFSQNLEQKTQELQLFKEAHALSMIPNKKIVKVNQGNNYKGKEIIFEEVIQLIEN